MDAVPFPLLLTTGIVGLLYEGSPQKPVSTTIAPLYSMVIRTGIAASGFLPGAKSYSTLYVPTHGPKSKVLCVCEADIYFIY
jgi:hypothetical protein